MLYDPRRFEGGALRPERDLGLPVVEWPRGRRLVKSADAALIDSVIALAMGAGVAEKQPESVRFLAVL